MNGRAFQARPADSEPYGYENRMIFIARLAKNKPDGYENRINLISRLMKKSQLFHAKFKKSIFSRLSGPGHP
jgi:hypothetical protein